MEHVARTCWTSWDYVWYGNGHDVTRNGLDTIRNGHESWHDAWNELGRSARNGHWSWHEHDTKNEHGHGSRLGYGTRHGHDASGFWLWRFGNSWPYGLPWWWRGLDGGHA